MKYIILDRNGNPRTHVFEIIIYSTYEAAKEELKNLPEGYSVSLLKERR